MWDVLSALCWPTIWLHKVNIAVYKNIIEQYAVSSLRASPIPRSIFIQDNTSKNSKIVLPVWKSQGYGMAHLKFRSHSNWQSFKDHRCVDGLMDSSSEFSNSFFKLCEKICSTFLLFHAPTFESCNSHDQKMLTMFIF